MKKYTVKKYLSIILSLMMLLSGVPAPADDGVLVVTPEPTAEVTVEPTAEVTVEPTVEVTVEPTVEPTVDPTEEPAVDPTEEPAAEPTEEPVAESTEEPVVEPTAAPAETEAPLATAEPTAVPVDEAVESVRALIAALPDASAIAAMTVEEMNAVYTATLAADDAYQALTDDQKSLLTVENEKLDALFAAFASYVAPVADNVASVTIDGKVDAYTDFAEALAAANASASATLTLLQDVTLTDGISITGGVTLKSENGASLSINTSAIAITVDNGGSLTVAGLNITLDTKGYTGISVASGSRLGLSGGTISYISGGSTGVSGVTNTAVHSYGTVTVNGAAVNASAASAIAVLVQNAGFTMSSGLISGAGNALVFQSSGDSAAATASITGGTLSSASGTGIGVNGSGTLTMSNGTVNAATDFSVSGGTVRLSGGSFPGGLVIAEPAFGTPTTLADILAENYVFYVGDSPASYDETATSIEGDVTVAVNADMVATVTIGDETEYYTDLYAAFNAAEQAGAPATVTLLRDVTDLSVVEDNNLDGTISVSSGEVTLNLNGHKIHTTASNRYAIRVTSRAKLTITGEGVITSEVNRSIYNSGELVLQSGCLKGLLHNNAVFTMYGGELDMENSTSSIMYQYGTFTLYGGELTCGNIWHNRGQGTTLIYGGRFPNGLTVNNKTLAGVLGSGSMYAPADSAAEIDLNANGFTGSISVVACDHADEELKSVNNGDGTHTATYAECLLPVGEPEAHDFTGGDQCPCGATAPVSVTVGSETKYYGDLYAAFNAAEQAGAPATVTLLRDVTDLSVAEKSNAAIYIASGEITLNLGAHTISTTGEAVKFAISIASDASLTIDGDGVIQGYTGSTNDGYSVVNAGTLTLTGGTLQGWVTSAGSFTMTGGTVRDKYGVSVSNGSFTMTNGSIEAATSHAIELNDYVEVTITGGTFPDGFIVAKGTIADVLDSGYILIDTDGNPVSIYDADGAPLSSVSGSISVVGCDHADEELKSVNNGDGTHTATYTDCLLPVGEPEAHVFTDGDQCPCGETAPVSVTIGSETKYYGDLYAAFTAAEAASSATVTLLASVTNLSVEEINDSAIYVESGDIVLNLGACDIVAPAISYVFEVATGATLTINGAGTIKGRQDGENVGGSVLNRGTLTLNSGLLHGFVYNYGTFTMIGGTVQDAWGVNNSGTFNMFGGTITGGRDLAALGETSISGGVFTGGVKVADDVLASVLADGYGFFTESGILVNLTDSQTEITETVSVRKLSDAAASVTIGDETVAYLDLSAAFAAAHAADAASVTVTLLRDVTGLEESIRILEGSITLNLGNYTIATAEDAAAIEHAIEVASGASLTVTGSGSIKGNGYSVLNNGTLTLQGGTLDGTVINTGNFIMTSGAFVADPDMYVEGGTVEVSGGTFLDGIYMEGIFLAEILATGYAFVNEDGELVDDLEDLNAIGYTVTVVECPHPNGEFTDITDDTHTVTCADCGLTDAVETHTLTAENGYTCACGLQMVATVTIGDGEPVYYADLVAAFADAQEADQATVTLIKSLTEVRLILEKGDISLEMKGHSLTGLSTQALPILSISEGASLTFMDNGTLNGGSGYAVSNSGSIVIAGSIVTNRSISGGEIQLEGSGSVTMTDGDMVALLYFNSLTMSGGMITGGQHGPFTHEGSINISAGSITSSGYSAYAKEIKISGGVFTADTYEFSIDASQTLAISGGEFVNGLRLKSNDGRGLADVIATGYILVDEKGDLVPLYDDNGAVLTAVNSHVYVVECNHAGGETVLVNNGDGTHSPVCAACGVVVGEPVDHSFGMSETCDCGETAAVSVTSHDGIQYFADLASAFEVASDMDAPTVTLLKEQNKVYVTLAAGSVTLNMNGKTLTDAGIPSAGIINVSDGAHLTVTGSGTLVNYAVGSMGIMGGTVTIEGTINSNRQIMADFLEIVEGASLIVSEGEAVYEGDLMMTGGSVIARSGHAIKSNGGSVTISGGTVTTEGDGYCVYASEAIITGGTFTAPEYEFRVENGVTLRISGGEFVNGLRLYVVGNYDLLDVIVPGYILVDTNNNPVAIADGQTAVEGYVKVVLCPHEHVVNGTCLDCGLEFDATVTVSDDVTYYSDFVSAFAAAEAAQYSTLTLLQDIDLTWGVTISTGDFDLDTNGHDITVASGDAITITGGQLVILGGGFICASGTDSSTRGVAVAVSGGTVHIQNVTLNGEWTALTVSGGYVELHGGAAVAAVDNSGNAVDINITGGDFMMRDASIGGVAPVNIRLAEGCIVNLVEELSTTVTLSVAAPGKVAILPAGSEEQPFALLDDTYILVRSGDEVYAKLDITDYITVSDDELFYDGTPKTPVAVDESVPADGYTVSYTSGSGYNSSTAPTNAGRYEITITGTGNYTGEYRVEFDIQKVTLAASDFSATLPEDAVYSGEAHAAVVTFHGGALTDGMTVLYNGSAAAPVASDTYQVTVKVEDDSCYNDGTFTLGSFTVAQREITVSLEDQTIEIGLQPDPAAFTVSSGTLVGGHEVNIVLKSYDTSAAGTHTLSWNSITVVDSATQNDITANYAITQTMATLTVVDHEHDWTFSAYGSVLAAICADPYGNCPDKEQSIEVVAPSGTPVYNGEEWFATVLGSITGETTPDVLYTDSDGNTSASAPVNAGTYTASITIDGATATVEFTVAKATPVLTWDEDEYAVDYTGNAASVPGVTITLVNGVSYNGTVTYSYTENGVKNSGLPTNAGTYTVTAHIAAQDDYEAASSGELTLTVNPVDPAYTVPTGLTATYGDTLADVALPGGFSWTNDTLFVGNTGMNNFTVTFTPEDTRNYNTITGIDVIVHVDKADPIYTVPSGLTATYGDTLADVVLPIGFSWTDPTLSVGNTGENDFTVTYTPADTDNYNIITGIGVTVAVAKADPAYTTPSGLTATYGDTLADVALPGGFTWTNDTLSVGNAGENDFTVTFTPEDTRNYNTITGISVTVAVVKADPAYTAPSGLTATYGDTLVDVALPTGFSWTDPTLSVGNTGENDFTVTFTPVDPANYNTITGIEVTVTVAKADPAMAWQGNPDKWTTTYTGNPASLPDVVMTIQGNDAPLAVSYAYSGTTRAGVVVVDASDIPTEAGEYTVTASVAGSADYSADSITLALTIEPKDISNEAGASWYDFIYNGAEQTVEISLDYGSLDLVEGTHYTVAADSLVGTDAGTYTAGFTFINNYTGSMTVDWMIAQCQLEITPLGQTITLGETIYPTAYDASGILPGHEISLTLAQSTENVTYSGTISVSTISIADADGNDVTANYDITLNTGRLVIKPDASAIDGVTLDNVTGDHADAIDAIQEFMAEGDTAGMTAEEQTEWDELEDRLAELEQKITDVAAEVKRLDEAVDVIDLSTVTSDDEADLGELLDDIYALLNGENLTEEQRETLEGALAKLRNAIDTIARIAKLMNGVKDTVDGIDPDTMTGDDKEALENAKETVEVLLSGDNLTDEERAEMEEIKETIDGLLTELDEVEAVIDSVEDRIGGIGDIAEETVNSNDREALEQTEAAIDELLNGEYGDNLTDEQKQELEDAKERIDGLLTELDEAETAIESVEKEIGDTDGLTPDTVVPEDRAELEQAKAAVEDLLSGEYADNLTDDEKAVLEEELDRIEKILDSLDAVDEVIAMIEALPDPDRIDRNNANHKAAVEAAKEAYNQLTDHEKALVDEAIDGKLADALEALEGYRITRGNWGTWELGGEEGMSFTANGPYNKFHRVLIDGEELDSSLYESRSGSTVITISPEFLETLTVGRHTISIQFTDGSADGYFKVEDPNIPKTGDSQQLLLWTLVLLVSLIGFTGVVSQLAKGKKRHNHR